LIEKFEGVFDLCLSLKAFGSIGLILEGMMVVGVSSSRVEKARKEGLFGDFEELKEDEE